MLRVELEGSDRAYVGKHEADSVMALARKLVEAGFPDQPLECWRGDMLCLTFKSLYWAAAHTIREEPVLRIEKYKKFGAENLKHGIATGTDSLITGTARHPETLDHP